MKSLLANYKEDIEYYTPNIEEFVQGFKFQWRTRKKGIDKVGILFFAEDGSSNTEWYYDEDDTWIDCEVYWFREPEFKTIQCGDMTVTYKELPEWDWAPWNTPGYIETLIEKGDVRAIK